MDVWVNLNKEKEVTGSVLTFTDACLPSLGWTLENKDERAPYEVQSLEGKKPV